MSRLTAKIKDALPWIADGFPIRCVRRKRTQDGIKKYWDRARVVTHNGNEKYEFKRTDGSGVIRMGKEDDQLLGDLEYFDKSYVIDRRKPFFEVFQNTQNDFHIIDLGLDEIEDSENIQSELAQNRNLYHQSVVQSAEDAVEIANPSDNKLTLAAGLFGIMLGTAAIIWVVMQGIPNTIAESVSQGVSDGLKEAGVASSSLVAFTAKKHVEKVKDYVR